MKKSISSLTAKTLALLLSLSLCLCCVHAAGGDDIYEDTGISDVSSSEADVPGEDISEDQDTPQMNDTEEAVEAGAEGGEEEAGEAGTEGGEEEAGEAGISGITEDAGGSGTSGITEDAGESGTSGITEDAGESGTSEGEEDAGGSGTSGITEDESGSGSEESDSDNAAGDQESSETDDSEEGVLLNKEGEEDAVSSQEKDSVESDRQDSAAGTDSTETKNFDEKVIVGFENLGDAALISLEYKLALVELEKLFPEKIDVRLGKTAVYENKEDGSRSLIRAENYDVQTLEVKWKCVENYDEELDVFHFIPVLDEYTLADTLKLPQITVEVKEKFETPPLMEIEDIPDDGPEVPVIGAVASDGTPINRGAFPSKYDAYSEGRMPAVRDQSPYGTCWAHASIGAIETDLITDGKAGTDIDLSELHLSYFSYHNYYDEKGCNSGDTITTEDSFLKGGHIGVAYKVMANMVGPALEKDAPYSLAENYSPSAADGRALSAAQITGAYEINSADQDAIKNAIMDHGGVSTSYFSDDNYYSYTYNSYYYPVAGSTNHAVMLVGWDDNFSRNSFSGGGQLPEKDGAWLVRNSWGYEGYGYRGYFWISYYDKSLFEKVYAFDTERSLFKHCYAYDSIPFTAVYRSETGMYSGVQYFNVDGREQIRAVGIQTFDPQINVEIKIESGQDYVLTQTKTGYPGYYLVSLDTPFSVLNRTNVKVTVTYRRKNEVHFPVEAKEVSFAGSKYIGNCGSGEIIISDGNTINNYKTGYDGCFKLFTMDLEFPLRGKCGNLNWVLEKNRKLTISGSGSLDPVSSLDADTLKIWREYVESVVVKQGITSIRREAFSNFTRLKNVTLPASVTMIGDKAFSGCQNLAGLQFPGSLTSIGEYAFYGCQSLTGLQLPGSLTSIGTYAFYGCKSIQSAVIPYGVKKLEDSVFQGCVSLADVTISGSVSSIGKRVFRDCKGLKNVTLREGLTSIDNAAFSHCENLTSVTIPRGLVSIGQYVFFDCSRLVKITIPVSVKEIGKASFSKCTSLKNVYYGSGRSKWKSIKIDSNNSCLSSAAIHYTYSKPVITSQPVNKTGYAGKNVSLSVSAKGEDLVYLWQYYNGSKWCACPGKNSARTITIKAGITLHNRRYRCCVSNPGGKVISSKAVLTVKLLTPGMPKVSSVKGGVKVSWKAVSGAAKYRVYKKKGNGSWTLNRVTAARTITDKKVVSGQIYQYKVKAVSSNGLTGSLSKSARIQYVATPVISGVKAIKGKITLKWKKVPGAYKYRVFRKTGSGKWTKLADTRSLSYSDLTIISGKKYSYTIRCFNSINKAVSAYDTKGKVIVAK